MGVRGQRQAPAALYHRKKTRYLLYRSLGGPQGRCGQMRKISLPLGSDPRTFLPVASRYTVYATRPTKETVVFGIKQRALCYVVKNNFG
jgi:hypothetical protein